MTARALPERRIAVRLSTGERCGRALGASAYGKFVKLSPAHRKSILSLLVEDATTFPQRERLARGAWTHAVVASERGGEDRRPS